MKIKKAIAALTIGVLAALATPAPAQAALSDCTAYPNTFCLWEHSNYGGAIWRQKPEQIGNCTNVGYFNDRASHVRNNTPGHYILVLWWDSNCTGQHFDANPQTNYNLAGNGWNDQISSVSMIAL